MFLDTQTLIIVSALSAIVSGLGLFIVASLYRKPQQAILYWIAANMLDVLGCVLIVLRGHIPLFLSIVVANTALNLSLVLYYRALTIFYNRPAALRLPLSMIGVVFLSFIYFSMVAPNENARIVISALSLFVLTGMCAVLLYAQHAAPQQGLRYSMALGFVMIGTFWIMRAIAAVVLPHSAVSIVLLNAAYAMTLLVAMFHVLGFVLLINERTNADLRRLATTDELTEIFNRRTIEAMATHAVAYARRSKSPFAVMLLDVDAFKQVNDTYGHAAGDQVLRRLVTTLVGSIRQQDVAGRFGGEEFIVLLPGTPETEAERVADRVRNVIANTPIEIGGRQLNITISAGVAGLDLKDDDARSLILRADRALYRAKAEGRNRVILAPHLVESDLRPA